ncbi:MAG: amidohydrolase [Gemmataceae bacterium]
MRSTLSMAFACVLGLAGAAHAQRATVVESVNQRSEQSWDMAKKIWGWAEPGYKETRSSALLAGALKEAGFKIDMGVAGIPTAFTATLGEGKPVIGILGEYDALPGLSQEAVPERKVREGNSEGHGCGHHLFGVASAEACIALAPALKAGKIKGTLRFYGCPAEEGGAAKVFMVRAGLFKDCAVVLHWHPSNRNVAGDGSCLARMAVKFRFHGKSAHAAGAPEKGRSALDAVELTNHAAQLLREHTPDLTRIHHVVTYGGGAPNVVPDFAEVYYYVRHPEADVVKGVYDRLVKCAQGAALATETRLETAYLGGTREILPNGTLSDLLRNNLAKQNDLSYTAEERKFAVRLQETLTQPVALESIRETADGSGYVGKGSTDVGDISWVVPTAGFSTACWVPGTPGHSWQAVAAGGTTIGKKGMLLAARTLAATAWDLFHDARLIEAAKGEQQRRLEGREYRSLLEKDQKPPLDYRDPPRRK